MSRKFQLTKSSTQRIVKELIERTIRTATPVSYRDLLEVMEEEDIFMPARLVDEFIRFAQDEGHQGLSVCMMAAQSMARELHRSNDNLRAIANAVADYVDTE